MSDRLEDIRSAQRKAEEARRALLASFDDVTSRLAPLEMAGRALKRAQSGRVDWLGLALNTYRYRGTALALFGTIAAHRAKEKGKERGKEEQRQKQGLPWPFRSSQRQANDARVGRPEERSSTMLNTLNESASTAKHKLEGAASLATEEAAAVKETIVDRLRDLGTTAADAYAAVRARADDYFDKANPSASSGRKVVTLLKENPVAAIAGGVALGIVIGALIPRSQAEREKLREYRNRLTDAAANALKSLNATLDDYGVNRENAAEKLHQATDAAKNAASSVASKAKSAFKTTEAEAKDQIPPSPTIM